jgi:hypothetical protein
MFWPVIVVDGQVAGLWKRTVRKTNVNVEPDPFCPFSKEVKDSIQQAAASFGEFLGKKAEVIFSKQ